MAAASEHGRSLDRALARLPKIVDKPVLVEVVIPQKDLPGQMQRLGNE